VSHESHKAERFEVEMMTESWQRVLRRVPHDAGEKLAGRVGFEHEPPMWNQKLTENRDAQNASNALDADI